MFKYSPVLAVLCAALPAAAEEHVIMMSGSAYAPATIAARIGDTLRFVNDDAIDHNVFIPTAAFATDLGAQKPGEEAVFVLRKAGEFRVECVFHEAMLTMVEVQE